ncbi:MAG: oligoribonuclease [Proteobacteria bacterium]|nr:oligoribonuclease [Pseudomonadota bacterium]
MSNNSNNIQGVNRFIWIDLEMSGLDPQRDVILEAAIIITDWQLNTVLEVDPWVIHQPDAILDNMDSWNTRTHTKSGLIERCRKGTDDVASVERRIIKMLKKHVPKQASPMCGNSICQDRRFMANYMPDLEAYFHYRNFDVSAFKIATQIYYPQVAQAIKSQKPSAHQALDDVRASINEMRYYREHILLPPPEK